jgi:hypothetical protein
MLVGGLRKRHKDWNLAAVKDPGKLWIQEEIDCHWQDDYPLCRSGMAQEKCHQEGLDQEPGGT